MLELAPASQEIGPVATVLIADDEPVIVELVRFTLEHPGVRLLEARNGLEALQVAREHLPDLIFLDVHMPGLTGMEVCQRLRRDPRLAGACIVILTAAGQESARLLGRTAGADEYLTKPFSPLRLLEIVRSLLPGGPTWLPR